MDRVGVEFQGNAAGAIAAARGTAQAIGQVRGEAAASSPHLRGLEGNLGRVERGALAGSGAFRGLGRSIAFASAGFLGGFGLLALIRSASDELVAGVRANAQIQAALRSTGGVSGETAASLDALAESERRKAGVDTSLVKSAESMLLRFTQVRDVIGPGNDIFGRATHDALDLAAALGIDAADAAATLGKALQEPVRGVTQLRRARVALTADEITHIQTLGREGKTLEAQKAILDAVERSYAGTAKRVADATPWTRLSSTLKELAANGLRPLLPELDSVSNRAENWANHLEHDSAAQQRLKGDVNEAVGTVKDFAEGANKVVGVLGGWKQAIEFVIALKLASVIRGWTAAIDPLLVKLGAVGPTAVTSFAAADTAMATTTVVAWERAAGGALLAVKGIGPAATASAAEAGVAFGGLAGILGRIAGLSAGLFAFGSRGETQHKQPPGTVPYKGGFVDPRTGEWVTMFNGQVIRTGIKAPGFSTATPSGTLTGPPGGVSFAATNPEVSKGLVATARTAVGVPYAWGGAPSLSKPTDCSGLMVAVFAKNDISLPRTSQEQYARAPIKNQRPLLPGDLVFSEGVHPGHVGLYIGDNQVLEDPHTGDRVKIVALKDFGWNGESARWWGGTKGTGGGTGTGGAKPPKSTPTDTGTTSPIPARIRQTIAAADVAMAAAALTPSKRDDKAAVAEAKSALEEEIAWLRAKLKTNLGTEKRITLEGLLTGALTDLASLGTTKSAGGAGIAAITSLRNTVTQELKGLPAVLDDVEQSAVNHLRTLRDKLHVGMSAKDEAQTRASIQNWGKVLKSEISKQAKIAADAANEAARLWERGWANDVNRAMRSFEENVVQRQLAQFDRETQAGLQAIQAQFSATTPEEQALADFQAKRSADAEAKQKAQIQAQIAAVQAQLAALDQVAATGIQQAQSTVAGVLIDIATGQRTALTQAAGDAASSATDIVQQRKDLLQQLADLQDQYQQLQLDDQETQLRAAADASREAANRQSDAAAQAYQDERDAQRQHLQDMLDDQATALQQDLDDWAIWLETKKKTWAEFLQWLRDHGINPGDFSDPTGGGAGSTVDTGPQGALPRPILGSAIPFAAGGKVPGVFVGRQDTILARLTPGETVLDRRLSQALEDLIANGGGGLGQGPVVAIFKINDREFARAVAPALTSEQARAIGYSNQRN